MKIIEIAGLFALLFFITLALLVFSLILFSIFRNDFFERTVMLLCSIAVMLCIGTFVTGFIGERTDLDCIYKSKLKKVDDAQTDLQKFLIDHPEFKEE